MQVHLAVTDFLRGIHEAIAPMQLRKDRDRAEIVPLIEYAGSEGNEAVLGFYGDDLHFRNSHGRKR